MFLWISGHNPNVSLIYQFRVATSEGKVREIWYFFKVKEFCRLVREILNTKKVRGKSGNFIILAQNMCCSRYFDYLKCEKSVDFFLLLASHAQKYENINFRTFCAKKLFKDYISFICRIREVQFSKLVKGICHLSATRRQTGRKTTVFWSVKNWIWSVKSQGILFLHEGGHPASAVFVLLFVMKLCYVHDFAIRLVWFTQICDSEWEYCYPNILVIAKL